MVSSCAADTGASGSGTAGATVAEDTRCFVVYIHGRGDDRSPGAIPETERRNYWRRDADDRFGDFVHWSSNAADAEHGCLTLVTGYDGGAAFWDDGAAGRVAAQINRFITVNQVPDHRLILVAHSMGGLVARWIVNNGVPESAYYNHRGANFGRIVQKTKYVITVSTPHLGSPGADAVVGESDSLCGNFVGWVSALLGERDRATQYLRRAELEYGSASGGWMGDDGRNRTMYTIATRRWNSGNGMTEDRLLSGAWTCLGLSDCRLSCTRTAGDGLVTEASGCGRYERRGSSGGLRWSAHEWIRGRRVDWLRTDHNHNHSRFDDQRLAISNMRQGTDSAGYPGSYIGARGLSLE